MLNRAIVSMLPLVPRPVVWRISRRYIAGETLDDALHQVTELNDKGMSTTLDILGEDSVTEAQAKKGLDRYLEAIEAIEKRSIATSPSSFRCSASKSTRNFALR